MGKRKQSIPKHTDEAKRQQLQWNMSDLTKASSSVIDNTDHSFLSEETNLNDSAHNTESPSTSSVENETNSHTSLHALRVDAFYQNLALCQARLTLIHGEKMEKNRSSMLHFGDFKVRLLSHQSSTPLPERLPEFKECWLYVVNEDNLHMLYFEMDDNDENVIQKKTKSRQSKFGVYWYASVNIPVKAISGLKAKSFKVVFNGYSSVLHELSLSIYGCDGVILRLSHPSECIRIKATQLAVQSLMEYFYNVFYPYNFEGRKMVKAHNFSHLYENVMLIQKENLSMDSSWSVEVAAIYHSCLKPVLRPYQKESVAWMLRHECKGQDNESDMKDMHPLYCEVRLRDGNVLYYNRCGGSLIHDRPQMMRCVKGGILADEMGLGKTVEVLCCMLLNSRKDVQLPDELPVVPDEEVDGDEDNIENVESDNGAKQLLSLPKDADSSTDGVVNSHDGSMTQECVVATQNASDVESQTNLSVSNSVSSSGDKSDCQKATDSSDRSTAGEAQNLENVNVPERKELDGGNVNSSARVGANMDTDHHGTESNHPDCPIEINGVGGENKPCGSLQKPPRKRKSMGRVEFVPRTDNDDNFSIFSSKPMEKKQFFECNCGQLDNEEETLRKGLHQVTCLNCGMSQHAECMNYDLNDPYRGCYLCPHCHAVSTKIKSGATLIISPPSICHQWIDEIKKHIKECSIRVFIYTGVSKQGYIQPQTLARQDIVITTYDVLRKELDFVDLPHTNSESGRRFRHPKRFLATPSPLVAVEWWRICLDEAQMVECVTTKTAEMALRLKSVNRWCVTGTPLMRSVEDIYGLLLFLGMDPYQVQQWFRLLVWDPFCHGILAPMHHTLAQVLWRTAKKDVIDQIDLPNQMEEVYWLTFSPVEEHFYRRQYEVYQRNALLNRHKHNRGQDPVTKLHSLDRKTMSELLSPLFRLRQACCHPQIVRGAFLPINKTMMNMDEVLDHMTKKVKTECEEAHRQIVASLNGMAGLAIIRGKLLGAVEKYREVLRSVEEHKHQFRTDDLQQLHAMDNLAYVLEQKPDGLAPTLRDDSLREQCEDLKVKYMAKALSKVTTSEESLKTSTASRKELMQQMAKSDGDWWADIVDMTVHRGIDEELIGKVKDDLMKTSSAKGSIAEVFNQANGLMYVIDTHLHAMTKARDMLNKKLRLLAANKSPTLVQEAAMCCMRPVKDILNVCPFCKVDELFNEYESKLFMYVERGLTVAGDESSMSYQVSTKRQGTWADSEVEKVLKAILAFYRTNFSVDKDILEAANLQIKYLDVLKKEFRNFRGVWLAHRERVSATDELAMATERLRLREAYEPETASKILNVIELHEMNHHELKCTSDEIIGRNELKKKQGQLIYLTNLAKQSRSGMEDNPDLCPICQSKLGLEWSVLLCGHCFCLQCMRTLIDRSVKACFLQREQRIKCPMCRNTTSVREIAYVTTKKREETQVKGSHSTKVQAILDCLIKIRKKDPAAKSLIFSMWISVLDILSAALMENNIPYRSLHDPSHFQQNLSSFKKDNSIQVLLLPLHTGANGLNLIEANHVLLVEPELNLEEEAQAISRIYRIGQTRQTKIHRFLVRGTIEEKIFHMVKTLRSTKASNPDDGDNLELTVGHITSLLQQPSPDDDDEEEGDDEEERVSGAPMEVEGQNPPFQSPTQQPGPSAEHSYSSLGTSSRSSVANDNNVVNENDEPVVNAEGSEPNEEHSYSLGYHSGTETTSMNIPELESTSNRTIVSVTVTEEPGFAQANNNNNNNNAVIDGGDSPRLGEDSIAAPTPAAAGSFGDDATAVTVSLNVLPGVESTTSTCFPESESEPIPDCNPMLGGLNTREMDGNQRNYNAEIASGSSVGSLSLGEAQVEQTSAAMVSMSGDAFSPGLNVNNSGECNDSAAVDNGDNNHPSVSSLNPVGSNGDTNSMG